MSDILNNSNSESLRDFCNELQKFGVDIVSEMNDFFKKHQQMHNYWSGEQYDQFTEQFRILCLNTHNEVREMLELVKRARAKADELDVASAVKLDIKK